MAKRVTRKRPQSFSAADVKLTQDVKRANQRLRELEKQGMENSPAYQAIERLVLSGDPATTTGTHRKKNGEVETVIKFNTDIRHLSYSERRHLEAEVERFLNAETSTTKGYKNVAERAKKAYESQAQKAAGNEKSYAEWINIWSEAITKQYVLLYGSDETFNLIIKLYDSPLNYDGAVKFMQDHFGQPMVSIIQAIPHEQMEQTGDPWEWGDIFQDDDSDDNPFK